MRRSGRRAPLLQIDLETRGLNTDDQSVYFRQMSKTQRKEAAKHGWRNWFINRGRLPQNFTRADERRLSWRRVF